MWILARTSIVGRATRAAVGCSVGFGRCSWAVWARLVMHFSSIQRPSQRFTSGVPGWIGFSTRTGSSFAATSSGRTLAHMRLSALMRKPSGGVECH